MAPRRSYRSVKVDNNNVNNNLLLNDVLCPICRSILIEPVTIPCSHGFCLSCFEGTVANANLTCPLCRVRFSSWHRLARKENKIININLWETIKNTFPQQVENKLKGIEEHLIEDQPIILAAPGQIRREYEEQRKKELLEIQMQHDAETKASEELIKKIVEEEALEKNKLHQDEQLARELQKTINSVTVNNQSNMKRTGNLQKRGPLDKFLHNSTNNCSKNNSICVKAFSTVELSNPKNDISKKECETRILRQDSKLSKYVKNTQSDDKTVKNGTKQSVAKSVSESSNKVNLQPNGSRYFKPIDFKNIPPSKQVPIVKVPAKLNKACTVIIGAPTGKTNFIHNHLLSAFARFEMASPILGVPNKQEKTVGKRHHRKRKVSYDTENIAEEVPLLDDCSNPKLAKLNEVAASEKPCIRRSNRIQSMDKTSDRAATVHYIERSPNTRSKQRIINKIVEESLNEVNAALKSKRRMMESPPCRGFGPVEKAKPDCDVKISNNNISTEDKRLLQREIQEASDLEFARKLQEELNKGRYTTRSSIIHTDKFYKKHKQVKLDEMIKCRNKVK